MYVIIISEMEERKRFMDSLQSPPSLSAFIGGEHTLLVFREDAIGNYIILVVYQIPSEVLHFEPHSPISEEQPVQIMLS